MEYRTVSPAYCLSYNGREGERLSLLASVLFGLLFIIGAHWHSRNSLADSTLYLNKFSWTLEAENDTCSHAAALAPFTAH